MNLKGLLLGLMILCISCPTYAGSSADYKITAEVLDSGAALGTSTSFRILGKSRGHQLGAPSSSSYIIGEGFLRSVYFSGVTPVFSPIVTSIAPSSEVNTGPVKVTIGGANFQSGAAVKLSQSGQPDILASSVVVTSSSQITCTFDITGVAGGLWSVTVTNSDGRSGTLPSGFTVTFTAPSLLSITPNKGTNTAPIEISDLSGSNFRSGAAVKLSKTGESDIIGSGVTVVSANKITCRFDITNKTVGRWNVVMVNTDGQSATLSDAFNIESPSLSVTKPVVSSQNPYDPAKGTTAIQYGISQDANITIYVYNIRGERVWAYTATAGQPGGKAGDNEIIWDGLTAYKSYVSMGVYLVYVTSGDRVLTQTKVAIVK